jgi:5'-3' exonuclease
MSNDVPAAVYRWAKANNVRIVCAPFEAEWQLVALLRQGVVDAIVSTDTDNLVLGASLVFTELG